jgi:hypothetical protein
MNSDGDNRFESTLQREKRIFPGQDFKEGMAAAKALYEESPEYWQMVLRTQIEHFADLSR